MDSDQKPWWYRDGDDTKGPVSDAELRRLAAAKRVEPHTLVWREEYGEDWRSFQDSGLHDAASAGDLDVSTRWRKTFAKIEQAEQAPRADARNKLRRPGYPFSWPGLLFGPLYYLYLRMWHKALILIAFALAIDLVQSLLKFFITTPSTMKALDFLPALLCARYAKHDYYMFKRHGETMWPWKPFQPLENIYVALTTAVVALAAALILPAASGASEEHGNVLSQMSGVWKAAGLEVIVDLDKARPSLVVNGRPVEVTIKEADLAEGVAKLISAQNPGDVLTLRELWGSADHQSFRLGFSIGNGPMTSLGYVRPLDESGNARPPGRAPTSYSYTLPGGATFTRRGNVMNIGPAQGQTLEHAQSDTGISGAYCNSGKAILESQTFQLRAENVPVDSALDVVTNAKNFEYEQFMMASIRMLYKNPAGMRAALNSGTWMKDCIEAVRGF